MDYPSVAFASTREAAHTVYRHIKVQPQARHVWLLPRRKGTRSPRTADFAEWWLSPGPRWPSYRYGKLFLDRAWGPPGRRLPGMLRAGFTFARGFGRQTMGLVPDTRVIDANWFWYRFLSDSMAGVFDTPLRSLLSRCRQPVIVDLSLTSFDRYPDPGNDLGVPTPNEQITYAIDDESLAMRVVHDGSDVLAPLAAIARLRDLALGIEGVQDMIWQWIDLRLCVQAWYTSEDEEPSDAWGAQVLWENALAPWLPWVH